ncbi:MAG TPA: hypothetical protein VIM67_00060 [Terriglobus sp.]
MMHEDQHDQAIEDVLHALRTTEPSQGYEVRIHNALLQASQASHRRHFDATATNRNAAQSKAKSKGLLTSLLPRISWAVACAVLLILGIVARTHRHHEAIRTTAHANIPSPQPVIVAKSATPPSTKHQAKHATMPYEQREESQPSRVEVAIQTHEYIPEPPLPLTEQERLVLRMMRRNTAQQLAEYTPDAHARRLHEDAQAYNDYFAKKPLDGQPIYHQKIFGGAQ